MLFVSLRIENYAQTLIPHLKVYKSEELIYNEAVSMLFHRDTAKKCRIKTRVEMINNRIKGVLCMRKQFNKMTAKLGAITIVSLALITGCSSSPGSANNTTSQTATEMESSAATQEPLVVDSQSETGVSEQTSSLDKEVVSFETYFDLLGTGKQDFIDKMNRSPMQSTKAVWNLRKLEYEFGFKGTLVLSVRYFSRPIRLILMVPESVIK